MENIIYYRPEWTCGRYSSDAKVAIFYNLIEGFSYFFEDYSAIVIGEILSKGRNGVVNVNDVATITGIAEESIIDFFNQLVNLNLLVTSYPDKVSIFNYRKTIGELRRKQAITTERSVEEKLPIEVSNAEREYMSRVDGVSSVMFELTYACSEKCIHCYNIGATRNDTEKSGRILDEELNIEDYKRVIDELNEMGLVKVCLTGGDPFSKSIVWDIIDYLYEKEIVFDVFTNGQMIVDKVDRLAGYYPRLVGVSIYSGDEKEHDYITRIKGSWQKSMTVVKQLSEFGVPMNLKCCVMRPNVKNYYKVADLAREYGAVHQFEISITDSVEGDKCASRNLRLTPELMEIVLRDSNIPLYVGQEAPNYGGQPRLMTDNACGAGENSFCITPDGNLIPCCAFHAKFGNVKTQSVKNIIEQNRDLHWWQNLTLNDYEECGRYDYCDYCNLCPGNNFSEFGTPLKASENNCYIAKIRYNLAMRMMKEGYDPLNGYSLFECLSQLPDFEKKELKREYSEKYCDIEIKR